MRATRVLYPDGQPDVYLKMNQGEAERLKDDLRLVIDFLDMSGDDLPVERLLEELERVLGGSSGTRSGT